MSDRHHGACLCGAVRFEIEGAFGKFFLCHCGRCRKDTGSAHAANLFAPAARLRWKAGEQMARFYRLPDTRHMRSFCANCGSALPYQGPGGDYVVVPAGSLDSPVALRPDAHIFVSNRADWDHELATLPSFERFPS